MKNNQIKVWLPAIRTGSGADIYTRRLAEALQRHGIETHITWFTKYDELLPVRLMLAVTPPGTNLVLANSWAGYAFRRLGIPLIVTVHHAIFERHLDVYKSFSQRLYHRHIAEAREFHSLNAANAVVAVSPFVANQLRDKYGLENVEVIGNWVDFDKFCPPLQPERQRPFRLLFVAKPTLLKGVDLLAPIMRELGSDFELHVTASEYECHHLNFPSNVHLLGRLSEGELINAYQRCDALLCPSRSEGFGYVALEAMACGRPVIGSDTSALGGMIEESQGGICCEPDNVDAFVNACRQLAGDPVRHHKIGMAARNFTAERFSEAIASERYIRLMQKIHHQYQTKNEI